VAKKANKRANRSEYRDERFVSAKVINLNDFRAPRKSKVEIIPRNRSQDRLLEALENETKKIVFAVGPAGCGKTWISTLMAIKLLKAKQIEKVIITRPNVALDKNDIGYLPGDILEKMAPWTAPVIDVFLEYYNPDNVRALMEEGIIELVPLAFIRGRTFKNSWIIVDEAQNTTTDSMKSTLTRIGEGSKMVVTGDLNQTDIGGHNGLKDFIERFNSAGSDIMEMIHFKASEVERSVAVTEVLRVYGEA
jgi:phosphate starvation-inducible PhoH-like protein